MKALLHAHSDFSYDGESTLEELAAWGTSRELDFILLTEHVNDFDRDKMGRYLEAVDALPEGRCRLVPGLEFAVRGGFHVLGYNVRSFEEIVDPVELVRFIKDANGLSVLAHPSRYRDSWPPDEALQAMDGIEVWNARYDGRFLPSGRVLFDANERCRRFTGLRCFGGQDLHRITDDRLVVTEVPGARGLEDLLHGLRRGSARFGAAGVRLSSEPPLSALTVGLAGLGHRSYLLVRALRDRLAGD